MVFGLAFDCQRFATAARTAETYGDSSGCGSDGDRQERLFLYIESNLSVMTQIRNTLPAATAGGLVAWLGGYLSTYLVVAPNVRDSGLNLLIEALDGEPATYELVGWVFYNAHMVDTVVEDIPLIGTRSMSYIGGEDGFTVLLYLVPVALLFAVGLALARYWRAETPAEGATFGALVTPGYLLATVAGVLLFEISVGGATGGPDLLAAAVLAGIVYPLVCGGLGGAVGGFLEDRETSQP